jgi:predicted phage terminase large subunit-like protein
MMQLGSEVIWKPQPGPQTLLLSCPVPDILFGGARGGGKTDGLIGDWLSHANRYGAHARGLLFRRSLPELEEVQNRMMEIFPKLGATFKVSRWLWVFPNGAALRLAFLDADEDATKYQGHSYSWIAGDEVGNFETPRAIDMLRACLRSVHGVPCRLLLTANPGGKAHSWLKERYIDPARPLVPLQGPDGTLRVFIPSRLQDNSLLMAKDPSYVDRLKASGPSWLVRAWLEGDWNAREQGNHFQREWFPTFSEVPYFSETIISLDTAFKTGAENDFSVATVWGVAKAGFYLPDLWRGKVEFHQLKEIVQELAAKWNPNAVLIEDKASGQSLIQELKQDTRLPVVPVKVDADKVARVYAITPTCEAGRVFLPDKAPWLEAFLDELMMFPSGPHDDQVDSFTQALNYLRRAPWAFTLRPVNAAVQDFGGGVSFGHAVEQRMNNMIQSAFRGERR